MLSKQKFVHCATQKKQTSKPKKPFINLKNVQSTGCLPRSFVVSGSNISLVLRSVLGSFCRPRCFELSVKTNACVSVTKNDAMYVPLLPFSWKLLTGSDVVVKILDSVEGVGISGIIENVLIYWRNKEMYLLHAYIYLNV